ncbi:hypothetical protein CEJ63_22060, partial [Acinetobacter baumannii]
MQAAAAVAAVAAAAAGDRGWEQAAQLRASASNVSLRAFEMGRGEIARPRIRRPPVELALQPGVGFRTAGGVAQPSAVSSSGRIVNRS